MPEVESPMRPRSCTDIPCTLLFAGALIGWIIVAVIASRHGSIARLMHPSDMNGDICGTGRTKNRPYLFFFDLSKCARPLVSIYGCETPQICVEKCPAKSFWGLPPRTKKGRRLSKQSEEILKKRIDYKYCLQGARMNRNMSYEDLVDGYHCPNWYGASSSVGGRCLPKSVHDTVNRLSRLSKDVQHDVHKMEERLILKASASPSVPSTNGTSNVSMPGNGTNSNFNRPSQGNPILDPSDLPSSNDSIVRNDGSPISKQTLSSAKRMMASLRFVGQHYKMLLFLSLLIPLLLSMLFIGLMRFFIRPMVWIGLIGAVLSFVVLAVVFGLKYDHLSKLAEGTDNGTIVEVDEKTQRETAWRWLWLVASVVTAILALLMIIIIIALRKQIKLAIALLRQCSLAMRDMPTIMLLPLIIFILQVIALLMFIFVLFTLYGTVHRWKVVGECQCKFYLSDTSCFPSDFNKHCGNQCPDAKCVSTHNIALYVYDFLVVIWALGFIGAVNQITVAMCFCTWFFGRVTPFTLIVPFRSLGSTLLYHSGTAAFGSLLITICKVVRWIMEAIRRRVEKVGGTLASCCMCLCICCCWCLENCLEFINRRAYIVTALESVGLCTGARKGMAVVVQNITSVAVTDWVAALVLALGRLLVVVCSVCLVYWFLHATTQEMIVPAIFTTLVAWVIASAVFSIYDIGVDTIFYCAMVDLDLNDGSPQRPYWMTTELAEILGVSNQAVTASASRGGWQQQRSPSTVGSARPSRAATPANPGYSGTPTPASPLPVTSESKE